MAGGGPGIYFDTALHTHTCSNHSPLNDTLPPVNTLSTLFFCFFSIKINYGETSGSSTEDHVLQCYPPAHSQWKRERGRKREI